MYGFCWIRGRGPDTGLRDRSGLAYSGRREGKSLLLGKNVLYAFRLQPEGNKVQKEYGPDTHSGE